MSTPLSAELSHAVDAYWAAFFGCTVAELRAVSPTVGPHRSLAGYEGVYLMEFGAAPVISLPPTLLTSMRAIATQWAAGVVRQPETVVSALGKMAGAVVGPARVSYTDPAHFRPQPSRTVRSLAAPDAPSIEALRRACSEADWEHGGSSLGAGPVAGSFVGDTLASLAGYDIWGGVIAHIAIVTHPQYRGFGHARAAVTEITERALERGLIPQYRTLESNAPAIRVGERLGYEPYATSLAVRLRG